MNHRSVACPTCGKPRLVVDGGSLRDLRLGAGWTLARLATHIQSTPAFLCDIEKNRRIPSRRIIEEYVKLGRAS